MTGLANNNQRQTSWRSLVRKSEFQKVYERGVKKVGRLVVVYLLAPESDQAAGPALKPDLAWAVVASKKVGNAVARSRAKRLLREARRLGALGNLENSTDTDQLRRVCERFLREPGGKKTTDEKVTEVAAGEMAEKAKETKTYAGLWVVLVARRRILGASSREVREELERLLGGKPGEPGTKPRLL